MLNRDISEIAGQPGSTEIFGSKSGTCDVDPGERRVGTAVWVDDQINLVGGADDLRVARRHGLAGFPGAEL